MPFLLHEANELYLGFAAIFACVGFGFLCLSRASPGDTCIRLWAFSFLANCLGFVFWSGSMRLGAVELLLGEALHIAGFALLLAGAIAAEGYAVKSWLKLVALLWLAAWLASLACFRKEPAICLAALKVIRSGIVAAAGFVILKERERVRSIGSLVAGGSFIAWSLYLLVFIFVSMGTYPYYGFLVGFHILAALGMVALIVERTRARAEEGEERIRKLEGILPICAYCKRIRDSNNVWHTLELYIEDRSDAEFSHGICPECFEKHRPDK